MKLSTRNLAPLPNILELKRLLQSLATLDAILSPDWESRYYSFNARWAKGEQMGSLRDGCGNDFFALFNKSGCFLKGFAHESPMTPYRCRPKKLWPGLLEGVPKCFAKCLKEPAFSLEDTTFCIWRQETDVEWCRAEIEFPKGTDPDGSAELLKALTGKPSTYKTWAEDYYEQAVSLVVVRQIYAHQPLNEPLVQRLNPDTTLKELADDLREIGYPCE